MAHDTLGDVQTLLGVTVELRVRFGGHPGPLYHCRIQSRRTKETEAWAAGDTLEEALDALVKDWARNYPPPEDHD